MKKTGITHARTCVYNVNYHIVWSVKYRRSILTGTIENHLKEILKKTAQEKDFVIAAMEVMPDHVHVFACSHPRISPSHIIKMLKGISSRKLFLKFPEIKNKLWNGHLWNSSFYLETIGSVSETAIRKYIENQKIRT